jgi:hypothetical protein
VSSKVHNLKIKLSSVEEPIKRLFDEKLNIQKKLDQKILDKCTRYLLEKGDVYVQFIMEHLVGILHGQSTADSFWVERYMKSLDGLNLALNRIDYSAQNLE